jgi:hypothetical protein
MATPQPTGTVVSNPEVVTEAGTGQITLAAPSAPSLPAAGGTETFNATTNLPDGTNLFLILNGAVVAGPTASSGGAVSFSYAVPANTGLLPTSLSFTVSN